jgi:hypothetical protein
MSKVMAQQRSDVMGKRTTKAKSALKAGVIVGASLAGGTTGLHAGAGSFTLPVNAEKLDSYIQLLEGVKDDQALASLAKRDLPQPIAQIVEMLNDETYKNLSR